MECRTTERLRPFMSSRDMDGAQFDLDDVGDIAYDGEAVMAHTPKPPTKDGPMKSFLRSTLMASFMFAVALPGCPPPKPAPVYRAFAVDVYGPKAASIAIDGALVNAGCQVFTPMTLIDNSYLHFDCPALPGAITKLNVHLTDVKDYESPYNCLADVPVNVNATLLIGDGPVIGNRYKVDDCRALKPTKVAARTGVVRRDGRSLFDDQGPLHAQGMTFFWAYQGETRDNARFIANLDWLTDPAYPWRHPDYLRILAQVDWQGNEINPSEPGYEQKLGQTIDDIYEHCRCRVEVTLAGGPLSLSDAMDLTAKVVRVINARLDKVIDVEMTNEGQVGSLDTAVAMAKYVRANSPIVAVGLTSPGDWDELSDANGKAGATMWVEHSDRDKGYFKWHQVRQMRDCNIGPEALFTQNEPPGPHSSVETNDSPIQLAMMRYTAHAQGCAMYVLHVGDMVMGVVDPVHNRMPNLWQVDGLDDIMRAVAAVKPWLPDGVENWQYTNQHGPNEPIGPQPLLADGIWTSGDDHGVDRAYGSVSGASFVEVLLGVKDFVNLRTNNRAESFDVFDPISGVVQHFDVPANASIRLEGRADTMAGYVIRGTFR